MFRTDHIYTWPETCLWTRIVELRVLQPGHCMEVLCAFSCFCCGRIQKILICRAGPLHHVQSSLKPIISGWIGLNARTHVRLICLSLAERLPCPIRADITRTYDQKVAARKKQHIKDLESHILKNSQNPKGFKLPALNEEIEPHLCQIRTQRKLL